MSSEQPLGNMPSTSKDSDGTAQNALVVFGRVRTVFGIKGWLKIQPFTESPEALMNSSYWLLGSEPVSDAGLAKTLTRVEADDWKVKGNDLLVHLKGFDVREEAQKFRQQFIHVPSDSLPALNDDEVYWHQLEGMSVYNCAGRDKAGLSDYSGVYEVSDRIGEVDHLMETGANDVLAVRPSGETANKELILVPYVLGYSVLDVDLSNRRVLIDWHCED